MKKIAFLLTALLVTLSASTEIVAADPPQTTNVTVTAYEYYDYYAPPERNKFKKVRLLKIEGQNRAGSIQAYQNGPSSELEVTLYDVAVPSDYYVTVVWQDGERYYQSFTSQPQKETKHQIYQPY